MEQILNKQKTLLRYTTKHTLKNIRCQRMATTRHSKPPISPEELPIIGNEMGFTHNQGIREIIYDIEIFIPDVSFPLIKISQYATKPAHTYFEAVRGIYVYLKTHT